MPTDARFRHLMDTAPALIWCADADRRFTYFNKVWLDFTGRTMEQEFGCGWVTGVHPEDHEHRAALFARHFERHEPFRIEFRLRRADGAWRWLLGTGVPRTSSAGAFLGFIGSCMDITEMKEAAAQRQRDFEEKAALLQELHHRVKNNAQVFASLLGVQASRATDPGVQGALRTAAARASAIAMAQQQIHDAGPSAAFDLLGYLRRLLPTLSARRVELAVEATGPISVPVAAAVPLALIVHELLTNAVRHGFADGRDGRVVVSMRRKRDGCLCLAIRDTGVGWEAGVSPETERSAGLTIVRSLARQLGGTLAFERGEGATVRLQLPARH